MTKNSNSSKKTLKGRAILDPQQLRQEILRLVEESSDFLSQNALCQQLGVKGAQRVLVKEILRSLTLEGKVGKGKGRRLKSLVTLPKEGEIITAEVVSIDGDGVIFIQPMPWTLELSHNRPIYTLIAPERQDYLFEKLSIGDHLKARVLRSHEDMLYAKFIRPIESLSKKRVGIFRKGMKGGGCLESLHRREAFPPIKLLPEIAKKLQDGDVVSFIFQSHTNISIVEVLGHLDNARIFSNIAIHAHGLPYKFSEKALEDAAQGIIPPLGKRTDYRTIDLVTIDGEDARDFDDAVWAEPDKDPRNEGGWRVVVAIADVSAYVLPGTALDHEAFQRGNSVYFPDRVVPMLPEALSNGLCSLKPQEDRACLVAEMLISAHGKIKSHRIKRGLMRSRARLTYNQVQNALNGVFDEVTEPLWDKVLKSLHGVYKSLLKARNQRGTLDLDMPERRIIFDAQGRMKDVVLRERHDSHRLIEELMIAANVSAAKTLQSKGWPCLYRVHDKPAPSRVENLKTLLKPHKIKFTTGQDVLPKQFNDLLSLIKGKPQENMLQELILRSQSQARYSPENIGHYGLNLTHYAHFTSPIRRYSDLVVHRLLISALSLGEDGYDQPPTHLEPIGDHLSQRERIAAAAEREVVDRYAISFVSERVGENFECMIRGVNQAGLFVQIPKTGGEGFIPKNLLSRGEGKRGRSSGEVRFDDVKHRLVMPGQKRFFQLGDAITATLKEADPLTNTMIFTLPVENTLSRKKMPERKGKSSKASIKTSSPKEKKPRKRSRKV